MQAVNCAGQITFNSFQLARAPAEYYRAKYFTVISVLVLLCSEMRERERDGEGDLWGVIIITV